MSWTGGQEYPGISIIGQPRPESEETVAVCTHIVTEDEFDIITEDGFLLVTEDSTCSTRKHFSKLPARVLTFNEEL